MRALVEDYTRADKTKDRVIFSYDGYSSYLLIVDEASRFIWAFLTNSKSPPLDIVREFLRHHGHVEGGCVRMDQGGELARSHAFQDLLLREFHYTLEPTSSDMPSQNGAVEIYNYKFGIKTQTLLYGSSLPEKYWLATLLHAVYLHNCLIHSETKKTPFEGFYGMKPDLSCLKVFGSRVCIKQAGTRRGKLDHNDFTGIFVGYTATDQNVKYIDLTTGLVKTSHHAQFDEAWYLQPSCPPAAQLLYDLGLELDDEGPDEDTAYQIPIEITPPASFNNAPLPPTAPATPAKKDWRPPPICRHAPLPLHETALPRHRTTAAARVSFLPTLHRTSRNLAANVVSKFLISKKDMAMIYMSPDPYHEAFEEVLDIRRFDLSKHRTAGLCLANHDGRLILGGMTPSTPGAKIPRWRTRIKDAWLIKVGPDLVHTIKDAQDAFERQSAAGLASIPLLFSHPKI